MQTTHGEASFSAFHLAALSESHVSAIEPIEGKAREDPMKTVMRALAINAIVQGAFTILRSCR